VADVLNVEAVDSAEAAELWASAHGTQSFQMSGGQTGDDGYLLEREPLRLWEGVFAQFAENYLRYSLGEVIPGRFHEALQQSAERDGHKNRP
jgi:hypothetical protein